MTTQTVSPAPEMPIWARLHMARFLAGLEVRELCALTGISRNTVANYESSSWDRKRNPAYIRLWALATGVPYEWLAGDAPNGGGASSGIKAGYRLDGESAAIVPFPRGGRPQPARLAPVA